MVKNYYSEDKMEKFRVNLILNKKTLYMEKSSVAIYCAHIFGVF